MRDYKREDALFGKRCVYILFSRRWSYSGSLYEPSVYCVVGKDVWWEQCENGDITFNDGEGSSESHTEGPVLSPLPFVKLQK
jgi:hypothetical protein